MESTKNNIVAKLEALLFLYGEPIAYKKIAKILDTKENNIQETVKELAEQLKEANRGLGIIFDDDKVQLITKSEFAPLLEGVIKSELNEDLSPASLETLSIITYSAPISRAEIDYIRGVNSSFILRALLIRGLIDRDADPHRANAFVYKPSFEFLKKIGIGRPTDLPEYAEFQKMIGVLRQQETTKDVAKPTEEETMPMKEETASGPAAEKTKENND